MENKQLLEAKKIDSKIDSIRDYDIIGHKYIYRVVVPNSVRIGDWINIYTSKGKFGMEYIGGVIESINNIDENTHALYTNRY